VRADKNPSDSNKAFCHAPTQGFRRHFGCPKDKKMSDGQANSIEGRLRYPKEGRTAQATDPEHPNPDILRDGRESEETAPCSVGRTKSAGSPTCRASPEQLIRRHSPRRTAPAPTTPPPQPKRLGDNRRAGQPDIAAHLGLPYAKNNPDLRGRLCFNRPLSAGSPHAWAQPAAQPSAVGREPPRLGSTRRSTVFTVVVLPRGGSPLNRFYRGGTPTFLSRSVRVFAPLNRVFLAARSVFFHRSVRVFPPFGPCF
jgi:hypothetical protein